MKRKFSQLIKYLIVLLMILLSSIAATASSPDLSQGSSDTTSKDSSKINKENYIICILLVEELEKEIGYRDTLLGYYKEQNTWLVRNHENHGRQNKKNGIFLGAGLGLIISQTIYLLFQ
jgi:hypothetical protein